MRVPSLGKRSLHLQEYQVRDSVVNSKVLENKRLAGMGAMGNRPYIEAKGCRLQRTTSEGNGAPGWPSIKAGLDSTWTPATNFWRVRKR